MMDEETKQTEEQPQTEERTRPRNVYDLLKLDTYDGMTDEEINLVVEWREDMARREAENKQLQEHLVALEAEHKAAAKAAAETAKSNLDLIISLIGSNYTPGGDDFEPKTKPQ